MPKILCTPQNPSYTHFKALLLILHYSSFSHKTTKKGQITYTKQNIIPILIPSYYLYQGAINKRPLYPIKPLLSLYHKYPYNRPPPARIDSMIGIMLMMPLVVTYHALWVFVKIGLYEPGP
jgi:hypothetical protein